jgi:plasmid stability protein
MASMTLKDIPAPLHKAFQAQAKRHKRSMNKELLALMEESVGRNQGVNVEKLLDRARRFRASLKLVVTDEEINRFKNEGRP